MPPADAKVVRADARAYATEKRICGAPCAYGGLEMARRRSKSDLGWMGHCNRRVKVPGAYCTQHRDKFSQ